MARSTANKLYRTFVAGLVTEASPLTYPENATVDEDNCVVFRKGNRTRRLGVEYENNYALSSHSSAQAQTERAFKEFTWFSVNNKAGLNFLVQQVGSTVYFYDLKNEASSSNPLSFTIDLSQYNAPKYPNVADDDVEFSSGRGFLFIVGRKIEPLLVEYDEGTSTIDVSTIQIQIRDFEGVDDGLANDEEPSTLTPEHEYNLKNQGWIDAQNTGASGISVPARNHWNEHIEYIAPASTLIYDYYAKIGRYPGNNKQWWVAKLGADDDEKGLKAGDFDPEILQKEYFGNTHAPQGHYILNAFFRDRGGISGVGTATHQALLTHGSITGSFTPGETVTGGTSGAYGVVQGDTGTVMTVVDPIGVFVDGETITTAGGSSVISASGVSYSYVGSGLTPDVTDERPEGVAFYAGRVWYGQGSDVYFSQVLTNRRKAGFCYQDADPTAEHISELLDTDGGMIPIPEARRILRLEPAGNGVLVFAENGVWTVTGTSSGFTASDYSVSKVSASGLEAPNSVVAAEGRIFWWSQTGIQGLQQSSGVFGPIDGAYEQSNVSQDTIQTLYSTTIPAEAKPFVKGAYDAASNTIQWLWATANVGSNWCYDKVLNYDLSLNAFYPWTISKDSEAAGPYICGTFPTPEVNEVTGSESVTVSGVQVIENGNNVTTNTPSLTIRNRSNKFIFAVPSGDNYVFTHGLFDNASCADWETYSGSIGYAYDSFIETGYELFDDAMRPKQSNYVFCYFNRSEKNFVASGLDYTVDFPSSCKMRAKWDWSDSNVSGRWSREVEAYRHSRVPAVDPLDLTFDTGFPVIVTKNKVRGHGRAIQLRFSNSEIGSNFDLLGWAINVTGNTQP